MHTSSTNAIAAPILTPTCDPVGNTVLCAVLVVAAGAEAVQVRIDSVDTIPTPAEDSVISVVRTTKTIELKLDEVAEAAIVLVGSVLIPVDELAMIDVGDRDVAVTVENNERSCCWNSTVTAWPHIVSGPVTMMLLSCESPERAMTDVRPPPLA